MDHSTEFQFSSSSNLIILYERWPEPPIVPRKHPLHPRLLMKVHTHVCVHADMCTHRHMHMHTILSEPDHTLSYPSEASRDWCGATRYYLPLLKGKLLLRALQKMDSATGNKCWNSNLYMKSPGFKYWLKNIKHSASQTKNTNKPPWLGSSLPAFHFCCQTWMYLLDNHSFQYLFLFLNNSYCCL